MTATSSEAIKRLENAQNELKAATQVIQNLIAPHDYADVAVFVVRAAEALSRAAIALMGSDDAAAFEAIDQSDDLMDAAFEIVSGDLDDES